MFSYQSHFALAAVGGSMLFFGCAGNARQLPIGPDRALAASSASSSKLAEAARALTGTWRCSGSVNGSDGAPSPSEVRLDVRLELDGSWLRSAFSVSSGKNEYAFTAYRTFETSSSKWLNVIIDNLGGHAESRSADGVTWTGESSGSMGKMTIRDTENILPSGALTLLGEYSMDGRDWHSGYSLSCKK